jgi:hypothetical protein
MGGRRLQARDLYLPSRSSTVRDGLRQGGLGFDGTCNRNDRQPNAAARRAPQRHHYGDCGSLLLRVGAYAGRKSQYVLLLHELTEA